MGRVVGADPTLASTAGGRVNWCDGGGGDDGDERSGTSGMSSVSAILASAAGNDGTK